VIDFTLLCGLKKKEIRLNQPVRETVVEDQAEGEMQLFEWKCPHCHRKFYSSCPEREKDIIECCYCNRELENPYADKEKKDRSP